MTTKRKKGSGRPLGRRNKKTLAREATRVKMTPVRKARIIAYLNAKEADELKAQFHREYKTMMLTVKHGHEIPTKAASRAPRIQNEFRTADW